MAIGGVLLFTALNLRTAVASVPPLLSEIRVDLPLSATQAGLLTFLPVICFALGSPLAPILSRRLGPELALLLVAATVASGVLVRLAESGPALFAGTALAGVGVALGNVLVPALIKRDFPDRLGPMTGLYTMAIVASGAIAAALTVPAETALGGDWRPALGIWAIPAVVAAIVWLPFSIRAAGRGRAANLAKPSRDLWRRPLAWHVAAFMGFQSLVFYALLSWLPELMIDNGISKGDAGLILSVMNLAGIPSGLLLAPLAARRRSQRGAVIVAVALMGAGLVGLLVAPASVPLVWALLAGLGQGATLSLCFLFFTLRASNPEVAAQLAAMAQLVGYAIAAAGPLAVGVLRDVTGNWHAPMALLVAVLVPMLWSGLGAARDRVVGD